MFTNTSTSGNVGLKVYNVHQDDITPVTVLFILFELFCVIGNIVVIIKIKRKTQLTIYDVMSIAFVIVDVIVCVIVMNYKLAWLHVDVSQPSETCSIIVWTTFTCTFSSMWFILLILSDITREICDNYKIIPHCTCVQLSSLSRTTLYLVGITVFVGLESIPIVLLGRGSLPQETARVILCGGGDTYKGSIDQTGGIVVVVLLIANWIAFILGVAILAGNIVIATCQISKQKQKVRPNKVTARSIQILDTETLSTDLQGDLDTNITDEAPTSSSVNANAQQNLDTDTQKDTRVCDDDNKHDTCTSQASESTHYNKSRPATPVTSVSKQLTDYQTDINDDDGLDKSRTQTPVTAFNRVVDKDSHVDDVKPANVKRLKSADGVFIRRKAMHEEDIKLTLTGSILVTMATRRWKIRKQNDTRKRVALLYISVAMCIIVTWIPVFLFTFEGVLRSFFLVQMYYFTFAFRPVLYGVFSPSCRQGINKLFTQIFNK
ncbi:unnamed protein product [Owenia fusiformis]|uniref:Uncharacterized protein n=1 Tax=Owenia fusiformis TaxID=6347 RepID=A0A8J1UNK2_OWEFU|nr:unnamed protein product [Owenia fusiformis]